MLSRTSPHPFSLGSWFTVCAVLLAVGATCIYFWKLGGGSLEFWDEALTAERSREFLVTGDWLTPQSNLIRNFSKPPVYYWLTAVTFRVLGQTEFAIRLWSVMFGLGCLLAVGSLAGSAARNPWAGLLGAFLLATNPHWINLTRQGMPDSGLVLGMLGGIAWLLRGSTPARRVVWSAFCFAFGSLVKNPLALLGALVPFVEFRLVRREAQRAREVLQSVGLAAVLILAWYGVQVLRWGPAVVEDFFGYNVVARFSRPIEGQEAGFLYPLETWWGSAIVALLLFGSALFWAALRRREALRATAGWWVAALVFLLMFSLSASKRGNYLAMVYPFAAVATAVLGHAALAGLRGGARAGIAAVLALVSVAYLAGRYKPVIDGCPLLKEAALRIRAGAGPEDVVVSVQVPPEALMFYSGFTASTVWEEPIRRGLKRFTREHRRNHYVVVPHGRASDVVRVLGTWKNRAGAPTLFFDNDDYSVVLLPARRPASAP